MKASQKILLIKTMMVLGPILLVIGILHFKAKNIRQNYTLSSMGKEYILIEKQYYDIFINKEKKAEGERYGNLLQQYYTQFLEQFEEPFQLQPYQEKIIIKLFSSRQEFDQHVHEEHRRDLPYTAGYYSPTRRTIVLYLEANDVLPTLIHEHVHAIFDFSLKQSAPPHFSRCINEGLASFFDNAFNIKEDGSFELFDYKKEPSRLKIEMLKSSIRSEEWIPVQHLIESSDSAFVSQNNIQYYSQSELLVYYLWKTNREALYKWFKAELDPRPMSIYEFKPIFSKWDSFEEEWKEFINKL